VAKKNIRLYLITLLVPVLFFAALEVGLVLADYDPKPPVFIEDVVDANYLVMNPEVSSRYFTNQEYKTRPQYDPFTKNRSKEGIRVFVQGASTSAGFPYQHSGSFSRLLEQKLTHLYPTQKVEVINTSLSATNSYTLLDLSDELINQSPDLVIIYAGHNEYYGAFGVGSSQSLISGSVKLNSLYLKLRDLRLMRLLKNTFAKIAANSTSDTSKETLMSKMVKNSSIAYDSRLYLQGIEQYRYNMSRLLEKYRSHNIPVVICSLISNEKDFEPFISGPPFDADSSFARGKEELKKGNYDQAKEAFIVAKDYDLLKFRAPEKLQLVIPDLAAQYDAQFVDIRREFSQNSPNGIIGEKYLLEHVHPNLKGQRLIAEKLFKELDTFWVQHLGAYQKSDLDTFEYVTGDLDSLVGNRLLAQLMTNWPFTDEVNSRTSKSSNNFVDNLIEGKMQWVQAMDILFREQMQEDLVAAQRTAKVLMQEYPHQLQPYLMLIEATQASDGLSAALQVTNEVPEALKDQQLYNIKLDLELQLDLYEAALLTARSTNNPQIQVVQLALRDIIAIGAPPYSDKAIVEAPNKYIGALGALTYLGRTEKAKSLRDKLMVVIPDNEDLKRLNASLKF